MDRNALEPLGLAMQAFLDGDSSAELIVRRDDGLEMRLPLTYFFRDGPALKPIDLAALECCRGSVLDVGAGSGLHSLAIRKKGHPVQPIDICPQAVEIMKQRGLEDARCADVFAFRGGPFDTILMMGHGIGMVETLAGLDRFLGCARGMLARDGQILLDSVDLAMTTDANHLAYHAANRKAGRYIGEVRVQLEFQGKAGPFYGWLLVTPETLKEHAAASGWRCDAVLRETSGEYLAALTST